MLSILEIIQRTTDYFRKSGIDNPRIDAEWIVAHALGCKRLQMFLRFDEPLSEDMLAKIRPLVKRRAMREPLQYILGNVDFCGLNLLCDKRALIPRPETEELAEWLSSHVTAPKTVLDLGTGTGALALALLTFFPEAHATAVDISQDALALAEENAQRNQLATRIAFIHSNWFEKIDGSFDLIVSNPPYLSQEEVASAQPEVKDFEPYNALVSDENGLKDLHSILTQGYEHLNANGVLACETGIAQHEQLKAIAEKTGYSETLSLKDVHHRLRFFVAKK